MALGDGIRYNIASVDPAERALLRDALLELNRRHFPGNRSDSPIGGVSWWFKQDETHQSTHVHGGPEFVPWHREIVNRLEQLIRQINPQLSLHYWDWTQDPRAIPNANLGGGNTGNLNLFTADFMGYGGASNASIGPPWQNASAPWRSDGFYVPDAANHRDATNNPFDPPQDVRRSIGGSPASASGDNNIVGAGDYAQMRSQLEQVHNAMHGFVSMGGQHISFRDPFVFFLHSNVDRLFAKWQTQASQTARLDPTTVYGSESAEPELNSNVEPWSGGLSIRPWAAPDNQQFPHSYKHPSVVFPPCYDTNGNVIPLVEVLNAGSPPIINFIDVPTGETRVVAAVFRVYTCSPATIRIKAGAGPAAPYSVMQPASGQVIVNHGSAPYTEARVWLALTAGAPGAVPDGAVTFECPESGKEFVFVLKANAIARPTVAVMLALDQSGSMAWEAGTTGVSRLDVLKNAATSFMELIPMNNAVGLIRFDHDAYPTNHATFPGLPMTTIPSNDINPPRIAAMGAVSAHQTNVNGNTSIGDGVQLARQTLDAIPAGSFDQKAMIVLTDGLETAPLYIADVAGSINNRTFAIGLGNEQQVNTAALRALANGTGGYLALTGLLSGSIDDYFRLRKYFQQILAGVTNTNIIVDPSGYIGPGNKIRIPFNVTEADIDCTAIMMMDFNVINFAIETPSGNMIKPADVAGLGIAFISGEQTQHYRFGLPVGIGAGQRAGVWHAVFEIDKDKYKRTAMQLREKKDKRFESFVAHGARYCMLAQTYSNLKFYAGLDQSSYELGATLSVHARLAEYDLPVVHRAAVRLELLRPDGATQHIALSENAAGEFHAKVLAQVSGTYHARIIAHGTTLRGAVFTREHTASAAVWNGGDRPITPPRGDDKDALCDLLACVLSERVLTPAFEERLKKEGINLDMLRRCVKSHCKGKRGTQAPH